MLLLLRLLRLWTAAAPHFPASVCVIDASLGCGAIDVSRSCGILETVRTVGVFDSGLICE